MEEKWVVIKRGNERFKVPKRNLHYYLDAGFHRVLASKNYWRRHDVSKTQRKISP